MKLIYKNLNDVAHMFPWGEGPADAKCVSV